MLNRIIDAVFGSKHEKDLKTLTPLLQQINRLEPWAMGLTSGDFITKTEELKNLVQRQEKTLDDILPEAFAMVREAARRVLGERLFDVQLLGGMVLHQGKIMEMKTGEGKTVSSVTAAYLNSLSGKGVHIITVNDYLAERDAAWMRPVYDYLGVSVGHIAAGMDDETRQQAYGSDITYGTNNEFGFDYLRDNLLGRTKNLDITDKVQRSHNFCIVDEIDSILIDEARTPLIISGPAEDDTKKFIEVNGVVHDLRECDIDPETGDYPEEPVGDFKIEEKRKSISFTDEGLNNLEKALQNRGIISGSLFNDENFEYIHYATQAMKAHKIFHRDTDYVVQDGKVEIVDEFTGRILHGRRYSDGLHQAIEAKEGIRVKQRNRTLATITFQNFFRMYEKLSGMTGTAETEEKEFGNIYGLEVVVIPTNLPVARLDEDDEIYLSENDKYTAICDEIEHVYNHGQPILCGTASIERSEQLSKLLTARGVQHEVLNAKNHAREAMIIAEAGAKHAVTIATNMAGRGTDIKLGGNPEFRATRRAGTDASREDYEKAFAVEYEKWLPQYAEVKELGGLYVLGTERHESRRIDNQLRGRSGRQGDPGRSRFFLSMDDDLMRLFGGGQGNLKKVMSRVGMQPGEPINSKLINKSIERAQSKVEERNFDIRKHLLEYDDVVNEQRKYIYNQRDAILQDENLLDRLVSTATDLLDSFIEEAIEEHGDDHRVVAREALRKLSDRLYFHPEDAERLASMPSDQYREAVIESVRSEYRKREEMAGKRLFNLSVRHEYLKHIDARWQDHIENLEALREAVHLRQYGQKNPLLEYKLEGFEIFDELLQDIRISIARKFLLVQPEGFRPVERRAPAQAMNQEHHGQMSGFAGNRASPGGGGTATATRPKTRQAGAKASGDDEGRAPVRRNYPKVGRNDPCPCGSGKKYKHCHGA
ncbi:MAG: preprotein translocase subunit SecA [Spirochaetales bacterium]